MKADVDVEESTESESEEDSTESESEEDALAWDIVDDLALTRAIATDARMENAQVRHQDAKARMELVREGTATWWRVGAEMHGANADIFDVLAEKYDAFAEQDYAKARAAKARGEEEKADKCTKDFNFSRVKAPECRTTAADFRKQAAFESSKACNSM